MDEWDAYFWPGSDVLRNIPGFTTNEELRRFEYAATRQRSEELALRPIPGHFDTAHFREIHRYLFQDVYEWAGEYRTVEFSKGSSAFAPLKTPAHTLETWGEKILGDLATENHLKGLKKVAFVERLTHHYGELNFWHAMREGNGRATKEFLYQLAKQAGYELEFQRVGAKTWNTAAERQSSGSRAAMTRAWPWTCSTRLFLAKVQAQLLERLSTGDIIQPRAPDSPAKDARDDYAPSR